MNRQIGPKRPGTEWSAFRHGCSSGRIFLRVLNFILCFFFLNRCTPGVIYVHDFYWTSIYSMDIMILHIFWFLWCTAWSFLPIFQAQVVRRSVTNKKRQSVTTLNSKLCLLPSLKQKKVRPMKIGHSQEETDIYSNHPFFRCVCCLSFREGTTLKIFRCCFQVVYHWSRPPPPWSHQHGFSDQTFSKDDRCGKFTSILWEHKQYPCKQGSGAAIFFDFSVLCRWISRETPSSWWISTSVVAGLTRSSPRICTTAQFRGARPWLDFGWANLLLFFCFKNPMPRELVFHMYLFIHTKTNKKISIPPKNSVSIPSCAFMLRFHGFHGWWSFMGKKPYHFSAPQPLWHP